MCDHCGCGHGPEDKKILIDRSISEHNDSIAHTTWHALKDKGILCINVLGAPGSGKTSFIEGLTAHIPKAEIFVIQGDLESDIDKQRLEKAGIVSYQINTHSGCHLDATMIQNALEQVQLKGCRYLLIENVGNLVCTANVKLGQHLNILVSSTTEGDDKPMKYPHIFADASMIVISKIDIADAVGFDEERYTVQLRKINHAARICRTERSDPGSFKEPAFFIVHQRDHLLGIGHSH